MSRCTGCDRVIAGTSADPVHAITGGVFCLACFRERLHTPAAPAKASTRGEAAKARWAAMTPEERAERVAKLRAGRRGIAEPQMGETPAASDGNGGLR